MTKVVIKLLDSQHMADFYAANGKSTTEVANSLNGQGKYRSAFSFETDKTGTDAAEEAFDLTNNPSRQSERAKTYGRGRSVSVGDIIEVDDTSYLCAGIGWVELNPTPKAKPAKLGM